MKPYFETINQIKQMLDSTGVPFDKRNNYPKWVRFYFDYCEKYPRNADD
jgi:hypothetical protein